MKDIAAIRDWPECTPSVRHFFPIGTGECSCGALVRPAVDVAEATLFNPNPLLLAAAELAAAMELHHASHKGDVPGPLNWHTCSARCAPEIVDAVRRERGPALLPTQASDSKDPE